MQLFNMMTDEDPAAVQAARVSSLKRRLLLWEEGQQPEDANTTITVTPLGLDRRRRAGRRRGGGLLFAGFATGVRRLPPKSHSPKGSAGPGRSTTHPWAPPPPNHHCQ